MKRTKNTNTFLLAVLLSLVGLAGTVQAVDGEDAWQDLACVETGPLGTSGKCYGSSTGCRTTDLSSSGSVGSEYLEGCASGAPKCRWYNAWEVDVEVTPSEESAISTTPLDQPEDWWVQGETRCGDEGKTCKATPDKNACVSEMETGSGGMDCEHSVSVGIPSGVTYTITCKDPANPYIAYRAVEKGQDFIWHDQIIYLDEAGNPAGGPGLDD